MEAPVNRGKQAIWGTGFQANICGNRMSNMQRAACAPERAHQNVRGLSGRKWRWIAIRGTSQRGLQNTFKTMVCYGIIVSRGEICSDEYLTGAFLLYYEAHIQRKSKIWILGTNEAAPLTQDIKTSWIRIASMIS